MDCRHSTVVFTETSITFPVMRASPKGESSRFNAGSELAYCKPCSGVVGLAVVVAVVVARDGMTVVAEEVIAFAKANLASYKAPKRVVVIPYEEMPINYSGKIVKRDLRALIAKKLAA